MNVYAIICTRSREEITPTTDKLVKYFSSAQVKVNLMVKQSSIFGAYHRAVQNINPGDDDILIFCHDDIEIHNDPQEFASILVNSLDPPEVGFVGPAGTTELGSDAVWWNHDRWKFGKHRGRVFHVDPDSGKPMDTLYGFPGDVVALDGLFLACKGSTAKDIITEKPEYFTGEWDFYDIHYTTSAFLKGYTNRAIDIKIIHHSLGELVGRDSWHRNREAFIAHTDLPLSLED
jgi:hypothetical protein